MPDHHAPTSSHVSDDELLDLLHGDLEAEACQRTLSHAKSCAHCDARFREMVDAHERGRAQAAGILEGRSLEAVHGSTPVRAAAARRGGFTVGRGWLAAAGLVVAIGAALLMRPREGPPARSVAADPVWIPGMTPSGQMRSAADAAGDSVMAGVSAYERRDLPAAIRLLTPAVAEASLESLRQLYLANALVHAGQEAAALPILRGYESKFVPIPEPWRGEWLWTYLVALGRTGSAVTADSLAHELALRDDAIGARARSLLESAAEHRPR